MKRISILKTIELIAFTALALYGGYRLRTSASLRSLAAEYSEVQTLIYALWFGIAAVFLTFFADFTALAHVQKEFTNMKMLLHSDTLSQIANRNGCDELINRYIDKQLPEGFTCVMLMLTNIYEINEKHGRPAGNQAIQDFSVILHMAARNVGFAGRNGGNKFILLFEHTQGASECELCLARIRKKVDEYNTSGGIELKYAYGEAVSHAGDGRKIHDLIALADRSIDDGSLAGGSKSRGAEPEE